MEKVLCAEELYFVNEYIVSNRKKRILWELGSPRKRADCIWRFAHRARDFLKSALIHPVCIKSGEFYLETKEFLPEIGNPQVFVLHPSGEWDRVRKSFQEAFREYLGSGPYIMIDCNLRFVFIETESDCEEHEFLYLHE